ncbi:MAG: PASTA domain-containing protein [Actinomycetota bacterium]|nr:PASTA domain-containing protein [Actinomycetota bacterium]
MNSGEGFPLSSAALAGLIACIVLALVLFLPFAGTAGAGEMPDEEEIGCVEWDGEEEMDPDLEYCGADFGINSEDDHFVLQAGKAFTVTAEVENYSYTEAEEWTFSLVDGGKVELTGLRSDAPGVTCRIVGEEGICGSETFEPESLMLVTATYRAVAAGTTSIEASIDQVGTDPDESDNFLEWAVEVTSPKAAVIRCVVPKVKGLRLKAAKAKLRKANCKPGRIKGGGKLKGRKLNRLRVVTTKPGAGRTLKRGARVTLVVKKKS